MHKQIKELNKEIPVRFTKKQKRKASNYLVSEMEKLGYSCEITKHKKYFTHVENIIAGNLKQAKTILVVPYDTLSRVFWPKFIYYPLDGNKSASKALFPLYMPMFILYFVMLGFMYGVPAILPSIQAVSAAYIVGILLLLLIIVLLIKGFPSKHNAICNTSAIATALEFASSLEKEQRKNIAFVFTDQNSGKFYGASYLKQHLEEIKKSTMIISLNCVGAGGEVVVGYTKGQKKLAQTLVKGIDKKVHVSIKNIDQNMMVQSSMEYFSKGIVIASGKWDKNHNLYVDCLRRGKDKSIDENQLELIVEILKNLSNY